MWFYTRHEALIFFLKNRKRANLLQHVKKVNEALLSLDVEVDFYVNFLYNFKLFLKRGRGGGGGVSPLSFFFLNRKSPTFLQIYVQQIYRSLFRCKYTYTYNAHK